MKPVLRLATSMLLCAACGPLGAAVLYKSVDPNGTIQFSDLPPPANAAGDVKKLRIPDGTSSPPMAGLAQRPANEAAIREGGAAIHEDNAQADHPDHHLAPAPPSRCP